MITLGGLYQRIYKGMSEEEAVTKPLVRKSKYIEIAESNGISRQAYYSRIHRGWDKETASTWPIGRSEEHTSELQSRGHLVCRLLLEKKKSRAVCALEPLR